MAANTSARQRVDTIDISEAVNHRESAFLAPGRHDRNTIRLEVYFFLATRANNIAGRWAINDRLRRLPRVLYDCLFRCGPLAKHLECLQIRTVHRPSTCLKITPGAQKKPLNLRPRRRHGVPAHPERRWQVCGADPESGAHLSRIQPKQISFFHRLATNNTEMEPIVAVHANILSPTGPGLATEPPRYRRVATAPMPALVPNLARLCRFPGRDAGFGAQRGFCHPLTLTLLASVITRADGRG